jgi:hypothetical protein
VPPSPELIQKAKDAKKLTVQPPQNGRVRVEFKDFVQPADVMTIDVDAKAMVLGALNVATYLEKKEDAVTLDVRFGTLTDGTINAQLDLASVTVQTKGLAGGDGNIVIQGGVEIVPPGAINSNTLTLDASNSISWTGPCSYTNAGALTLKAGTGSITGGTLLTVNSAGGLEMRAGTFIDVVTATDTLAAMAPDGITINNTSSGTLTIGTVGGTTGVTTTDSAITLTESGSIDVQEQINSGTAQSSVTATAGSISGPATLTAGSLELVAGTTIDAITATDTMPSNATDGITINNT